MKRIMLSFCLLLLLSGCTINENRQKAEVQNDIINLYMSVNAYCSSEGCLEGEEISINSMINYYQVSTDEITYFNESNYDLDYETVIATYTVEGIYIHLEAAGDNEYEFDGLITNIGSFSKDDLTIDEN